MPSRQGRRPLKAWRYVGAFSEELMVCVAAVRIGPARQSFWAVWDRVAGTLLERTRMGRGGVTLGSGHVQVRDGDVRVSLVLEEGAGIETVSPTGTSYAWTRKQAVRARGTIELPGRGARVIQGRAVIDDTAAYYERHTRWQWCAGVGHARDGRELAWNLVAGVNDAARDSERTLWVDGSPGELEPQRFDADLTSVGGLRFTAEATRAREENRILVRSSYRQPFGTFSGELGGIVLADGYGVMEAHDVHW
jgi:hypothetical protein